MGNLKYLEDTNGNRSDSLCLTQKAAPVCRCTLAVSTTEVTTTEELLASRTMTTNTTMTTIIAANSSTTISAGAAASGKITAKTTETIISVANHSTTTSANPTMSMTTINNSAFSGEFRNKVCHHHHYTFYYVSIINASSVICYLFGMLIHSMSTICLSVLQIQTFVLVFSILKAYFSFLGVHKGSVTLVMVFL